MKTVILAMMVLASASGGPVPEKNAGTGKWRVVYKKSESHQFSGSRLKGKLKKPELSYIYERKGLRQEQIVNIPENFHDEIIKGSRRF